MDGLNCKADSSAFGSLSFKNEALNYLQTKFVSINKFIYLTIVLTLIPKSC